MQKYTLKHGGRLPQIQKDVLREAGWFKLLTRETLGLFIEKNNIYKNRFLDDGLAGVIIRIQDKLQRLSIQLHGSAMEDDEDAMESFLDIAVYALMGTLIINFEPPPKRSCIHLYRENGDKFICVFCDKVRKKK